MGLIEDTTAAHQKTFWNDRPVLVTGGAGFLGSWLSARLLELGAFVVVLDLKSGFDTLGDPLDSRLKASTFISGDVRDRSPLSRLFREYHFKTVFHLAAEAIVGEVLANPAEALDTNVRGTWTVLDVFRTEGPRDGEVVLASSDKAYGSHETLPYRENVELRGTGHPYDCSKMAADMIAQMYAAVFGVSVAVIRSGNIFGGGDTHYSRLIPDAISSFLRGEAVKLRSDGTYVRDYIYVKDVVRGYLALAELLQTKKLAGQAFNLANEKPIRVAEVVEEIGRLVGRADLKPIVAGGANFEIKSQYLDAAKARAVLSWRPQFSFEQGLVETIRWYKDHGRHTA